MRKDFSTKQFKNIYFFGFYGNRILLTALGIGVLLVQPSALCTIRSFYVAAGRCIRYSL